MSSGIWDYDCAVIGGGPGGLVSTLYLKRFLRSVVVINSGKPRASWIPKTHNLMGFPHGISGHGILRRLGRHLDELGAERVIGEAKVHRYKQGFKIDVCGNTLTAKKVILATGIEDIQPEIQNVDGLRKAGLLRYCPVCDAYDYRSVPITVLAQDDYGIQKALFMSRFTQRLKILVPEEMRVATIRLKEIREARATLIHGQLEAIEPATQTQGIWIQVRGLRPFHSKVAYVELGCTVRDTAYKHLKKLFRTKEGFLTTTTEQRTQIPGLFAVGDCVNLLGQISVAAGQAAVAATTIHNDLYDF